MKDCVFCKIIKGEIDSAKVWEDEDFLAILDIKPNTKGMTLVLTKKHYGSDIFHMPDDVYRKFMLVAKEVTKMLEKGLKVTRLAMVIEGLEINHAHIKLYPLHGLTKKFKEAVIKEKIFFDEYEGYISTREGPKVKLSELKELAEEIKNRSLSSL